MRQRVAAFRNRFRLSERNSNRFWLGAIIFAVVLPIVAMAYEIARTNLPAVIVFVLLIIAWAAVMWWGWRQPATAGTAGPSGPMQRDPVQPVPTTSAAPAAPQAPQAAAKQSEARKPNGGRQGRK